MNILDTAGTGTVPSGSMGSLMKSLGQNPSPTEIIELLEECTANDFIERELFVNVMLRKFNEPCPLCAAELARCDECSPLTENELRHLLMNLSEKLDDDEIDQMIKEAKRNKDGLIDYGDFVRELM